MNLVSLPLAIITSRIGAMRENRQTEVAALVALLRQPGARWTEITADVLAEGSAVAFLSRSQQRAGETLFGDGPSLWSALDAADAELDAWAAEGIGIHSLFDATYPARLRDIHQMPPVVFTRGSLAEDVRAVAVVGTRSPTPRGVETAEAIATTLAKSGVTVVSGLAQGIDAAAHTAALSAGGRTVAVIGTGVNRYYPAANKALQLQIVREGLVLSQFWPDAAPTRYSFPIRNAVMSGYAAATVVVEAAHRSGARMQARLALQHGRPVVLAESLLVHNWAREYARRPGVFVVSTPDEVVAAVDHIVGQIPDSVRALESLPRLVNT